MASRLVQAGTNVTGFDVNEAAVANLVSAGGIAASSSRAVVEDSQCEILILMVATAVQASTVLCDPESGAGTALPHDAVILLCITATPEDLRQISRIMAQKFNRPDLLLLDCPVSGGVNRAANGTLSILVSGSDSIPVKARRVLDLLSTDLFHVPGPAGSAFLLKMVHQILVGVHILATVETTAIAAAASLDCTALLKDSKNSDAISWLYTERLPHLLNIDHPPYSSLAIILKDLVRWPMFPSIVCINENEQTILMATARSSRRPLPLTAIAQQAFLSAKVKGHNTDDDCSTIYLYLSAENVNKIKARCPQAQTSRNSSQISTNTILNLLVGIHTAAALEALNLVDALGLDRDIFCRFVSTAAGYSTMFRKLNWSNLESLEKTEHAVTKMVSSNFC